MLVLGLRCGFFNCGRGVVCMGLVLFFRYVAWGGGWGVIMWAVVVAARTSWRFTPQTFPPSAPWSSALVSLRTLLSKWKAGLTTSSNIFVITIFRFLNVSRFSFFTFHFFSFFSVLFLQSPWRLIHNTCRPFQDPSTPCSRKGQRLLVIICSRNGCLGKS